MCAADWLLIKAASESEHYVWFEKELEREQGRNEKTEHVQFLYMNVLLAHIHIWGKQALEAYTCVIMKGLAQGCWAACGMFKFA